MSNPLLLFIILQLILLVVITLHDWVHVPPFTDIRALEKHSTTRGRLINSALFALFVGVPLGLTWWYQSHYPVWVLVTTASFYVLLTLGTILSWWIPYIFGSSEEHKAGFIEYKRTHHFLPARGDNLVPNTLHVILHVLIWTCCGIALYLLFRG